MFSDRLIQRIHTAKISMSTLNACCRESVIANLTFVHDAIVASEQLLIEAATSAKLLPRGQFPDQLVAYYTSHLSDELDHVKWLRQDLASAGVSINPLMPNPIAMAMVGTQYYMLKHVHPAALLGYMAVVEGDPVPRDTVELLEQLYGKELLRCVRFHSEKDLEHRKELMKVIDRAPEDLHEVIAMSADNTLHYLAQAAATWTQ